MENKRIKRLKRYLDFSKKLVKGTSLQPHKPIICKNDVKQSAHT